jgi:DNA-nicking Smr family endonuclease
MIAGYARAHPRHGGEGAVYIFLKTKRPKPY